MHTTLLVLLWSMLGLVPQSPTSEAISPEGLLRSVDNAQVSKADANSLRLVRRDHGQPIELHFAAAQTIGISRERAQWWVIPSGDGSGSVHANHGLWVLPPSATSHDAAWWLDPGAGAGTAIVAERTKDGVTVRLESNTAALHREEARPHSDVFGDRFSLTLPGGDALADTLAAFYWGTVLPSVVERTEAAHFPYSDGYVLSTLETAKYMGSYPAVDHEFQIRGRLALGSPLDLDVVRRMIDLQCRLMHDDPEGLWRAPTSVQPDGRREYHIRRDSEDHRENAAMFPVTGNIEVLEEAAAYYDATSDRAWLAQHINALDHAAAWVLANTDQYGRVWSDVYYEDQVIKDGRVTQAQAFAAHAFALLAQLEQTLGRGTAAAADRAQSHRMAAVLVQPLPLGFWDSAHSRFVDWVDRNGVPHDHIHLLANTVPVTFGYATTTQAAAVRQLVAANSAEFERFPSFVAADIAAYTPSEIGVAGPYDLCAAGRYWYWDAAFRASQNQDGVLRAQLDAIAAEARRSDFFMGERYDMDHVYYVDGKNAHGVGHYYEYPNVYAAVLISMYAGLGRAADGAVSVAPHLDAYGAVEFDTPAYALAYGWDRDGFTLRNLADTPRRFNVDLSGIAGKGGVYRNHGAGPAAGNHFRITLQPHGTVSWSLANTSDTHATH